MTHRLEVVDGLRGVAIVLVVLYHTTGPYGYHLMWPFDTIASTGFIGVSLFFFISGFCLFYPYAHHRREGGRRPTLGHFVFRRFVKIVPSYVLALTVLALLQAGTYQTFAAWAKDYFAHLFFLHQFFGPATFASISGPFWSIAVEVEFYVFFPLIAMLMLRAPFATYLVIALFAIAYRWWLSTTQLDTYFLPMHAFPSQIDLFVSGMLAAYVHVEMRAQSWSTSRTTQIIAAVAAIAGIGLYYMLMRNLLDFALQTPPWVYYRWENGHRAVLTLLFFVITLGSLYALPAWKSIVACRPLLWLAVISYNLYLWHDTIVQSCHDNGLPCSAYTPLRYIEHWGPWYFASSIVLSIVLATVVTYVIERPLLRTSPADWTRWRKRLPRPS